MANRFVFRIVMCALLCVASCVVEQDLASKYDALVDKVSKMEAEMKILKSETKKDIRSLSKGVGSSGTTYTRWGRTSCGSEDAQLLYRGHAAGTQHNFAGGGSNHLCLHESPQWGKTGVFLSSIYGIEWEVFDNGNVFSTENHGGYSVYDYPSPCAVCYVPTRSAMAMIPARTECPRHWMKEYQGYIVAEHVSALPGRHRSQYSCWDSAPESTSGGTSQNQAVIYPVQAVCGSLPCSRFVSGRAITCVVCTK